VEKQFPAPFPSAMADGVAVGHLVSITQTKYVLFIIRHNKWCRRFPLLIAEITPRRRGVNIRQHANFFPVSPQYGCQITPCSHFNVTLFQFHRLPFKVKWHPPPVPPDGPATVDFFLCKVIK
jgi:hypothetical protein